MSVRAALHVQAVLAAQHITVKHDVHTAGRASLQCIILHHLLKRAVVKYEIRFLSAALSQFLHLTYNRKTLVLPVCLAESILIEILKMLPGPVHGLVYHA